MSTQVNVQEETPLLVAPVQWSRLKHIDDVRPLDESDLACLAEVREVLRKYDNLERFGIALLHSHFPLETDEVMLEETDEESRVQILKPVKQSEVGRNDIGTIWALQEVGLEAMAKVCRRRCPTNILSKHKGFQIHAKEKP